VVSDIDILVKRQRGPFPLWQVEPDGASGNFVEFEREDEILSRTSGNNHMPATSNHTITIYKENWDS